MNNINLKIKNKKMGKESKPSLNQHKLGIKVGGINRSGRTILQSDPRKEDKSGLRMYLYIRNY